MLPSSGIVDPRDEVSESLLEKSQPHSLTPAVLIETGQIGRGKPGPEEDIHLVDSDSRDTLIGNNYV